jgi:hypothetical protein
MIVLVPQLVGASELVDILGNARFFVEINRFETLYGGRLANRHRK